MTTKAMKYRKKPVIIEAIKFTGPLLAVVASFREGRQAPNPIIVAKSINRFH